MNTVKVSQQLNLQKMPTRVEWEEVFLAIRKERGRGGRVCERWREGMIDVQKKKEEEELVKGGRVAQMPRCLQHKYLYEGRGVLRKEGEEESERGSK